MSILDNVKDRILSRKDDGWDDDYDEDDYYEDDYAEGDYYEDDDFDDAQSDGVAQWPDELDNAGRRAGRLEGGTPLVTSTDVRSTLRSSQRSNANRVPDYDNALSNYKIEPREGLARTSNHSPESLDAARQELEQLQQGIPVPLNSYNGQNGQAPTRSAAPSRRIVPLVMHSYEEVQKISDAFRSGSSAAVSIAAVPPELGRRILDFYFGVVSVSAGSVESLGNAVFFLNHGGIPITETEIQRLKDEGIL